MRPLKAAIVSLVALSCGTAKQAERKVNVVPSYHILYESRGDAKQIPDAVETFHSRVFEELAPKTLDEDQEFFLEGSYIWHVANQFNPNEDIAVQINRMKAVAPEADHALLDLLPMYFDESMTYLEKLEALKPYIGTYETSELLVLLLGRKGKNQFHVFEHEDYEKHQALSKELRAFVPLLKTEGFSYKGIHHKYPTTVTRAVQGSAFHHFLYCTVRDAYHSEYVQPFMKQLEQRDKEAAQQVNQKLKPGHTAWVVMGHFHTESLEEDLLTIDQEWTMDRKDFITGNLQFPNLPDNCENTFSYECENLAHVKAIPDLVVKVGTELSVTCEQALKINEERQAY